jgi:hypothetical protein
MESLAETGLKGREHTAAEFRADIEEKIAGLGVSFIVVIDDLDRLEPAHAVESDLGVQNGKLYLQNIIPLSLSLPRPERFDLRRVYSGCDQTVHIGLPD